MIKIIGHSNFKVYTQVINDNIYLIKKSNKINRNELIGQINKQKNMYNNNFLIDIKIPKILNEKIEDDMIEYQMEYIDESINIVDFLTKYNFIKINWFIKKIIYIIDIFISKSSFQKINIKVLEEKLININDKILSNQYFKDSKIIKRSFEYLYEYMKDIINIEIPIGICHGDLTLSNILIDANNMDIYLIDFLNSFIETPLFDIIKIRQDTKYYWILNLCKFDYDINKIKIIFNYIDKIINTYFKKYDFYDKTYKYFQIINILRIIQYCKEEKIAIFLNNILLEILDS